MAYKIITAIWGLILAIIMFCVGRLFERLYFRQKLSGIKRKMSKEISDTIKDFEEKTRKPVKQVDVREVFNRHKNSGACQVIDFETVRKRN